uniref:NAD dependent epimerase/dehydratase n=1 Tax=Mesocestoides corti TaxID=53468 RepID=A0A5K3ETH3_MESCO
MDTSVLCFDQKAPNSEKLLVIGAGLMRTGTLSLQTSLEYLLQRPCYHMSRVARELREPAIRQWIEVYRNAGGGIDQPLSGYGATVDYPACAFYKELLDAHPEAKVILTVRDADDWVASCRATMLSPEMLQKPSWGLRIVHALANTSSLLELHDIMFGKTIGPDFSTFSDSDLKHAFNKWNAGVIASVPNDRLLVFDPKDGWDPLCKFLGLPKPLVPFPHVNKRSEMREVLGRQLRRAKYFDKLISSIYLTVIFICILLLL